MVNKDIIEFGDDHGLSCTSVTRIYDTISGFECVMNGTEEQARECFNNVVSWMTERNTDSKLSDDYYFSASLFKVYGEEASKKDIDSIKNSKENAVIKEKMMVRDNF